MPAHPASAINSPSDHLAADGFRVALGKVEDRVDHEDVGRRRLLLEARDELVDDSRGLAGAADPTFDDRVGAVVAAQRAAALGLERLDPEAFVVARIDQ
jgi:hypothetical protein